ncbi:hypothetical protein RJ639_027929 [Escallonia herrerae]|uniref:K-box domain-containing protein n=1 Tax=Escallonia herrerae TaxID=1293975 RepID=A0AA89BEI7_9ASTE|nr:hypothetical protein RJ639_027929 [Escallonia herrerae]
MDKLEVVLGMDFMEKSSAMSNPYCELMVGKEGQLECMISLVSKDGADALVMAFCVSKCFSIKKTIERYREYSKEDLSDSTLTEIDMLHLKQEMANMAKKIECIQASQRKLLGQDVGTCSTQELQEIESQLEHSLRNVRKRKETRLLEENAKLRERFAREPWPSSTAKQKGIVTCSRSIEVETELFIGLPAMRCVHRLDVNKVCQKS